MTKRRSDSFERKRDEALLYNFMLPAIYDSI